MVIDWSTATDFDNNQQETGYHHDQPTGTDWSAADVLERGYSADVQSVGPPTLAYYPLAEQSGTTANDVSGNGTDGTYSGPTAQSSSGPWDRAYRDFDGTDDIIDTGTSYGPADNQISISAWVQRPTDFPDPSGGDYFTVAANGNAGTQLQRPPLSDPEGSSLRFYVGDTDPGQDNVKHTVAVDDGDWHFVTGAYDGQASGTNLRIFIDGESGPSKDVREYDISDEPDTHIIGGNANWLGGIAHVIFHDGALTQTEHTDLYEAAL